MKGPARMTRKAEALTTALVLTCAAVALPAPAESAATAESAAALDLGAMDSYVERCVEKYRIPGLSIAVVDDGATVFSKAYGEASRGEAASADTRYFIGSTSKVFTALSVLGLAEKGLVDLDAPYKSYVEAFELARPGEAGKITVRHLLNHTSGLSDRGLASPSTGEASLEAELARLRGALLVSEPGTRFRYYNVNYRLLALLVERVSGKGFGAFIEAEVFAPIGMRSSRAGPPAPSERLAAGHGSMLGLPFERRQAYRPSALASGYMISTAGDMAAYLAAAIAVRRGGKAIGALSETSLAGAWKAPSGAAGYEPGAAFGMGWMIVDGEGGGFLYMGGALENYQSALYLDPSSGRGYALLMNEGGLEAQFAMNGLRDGLVALMRGKEAPSPPGRPAVAILAALLLAVAGIEAFRISRLPAWRARRAVGGGQARAILGLALDLAWPVFLAFAFLPIGNRIAGDNVGWGMIWGLAPAAAIAAALSAAGSLARGLYKAAVLARKSARAA